MFEAIVWINAFVCVCADFTVFCQHDNLKTVVHKLMKFGGTIFNIRITKLIKGFLEIFTTRF